MKAVVMAGGLGVRLHPLTVDLPKPMVPLHNRPLLHYTIQLLAAHGFKEIVILLYHQPQSIREYFRDGLKYGVKISYVEAVEDYGTAGAVRFACGQADEPVLVISADLLTDLNLTNIKRFHQTKGSIATMALVKSANPLAYGIVETDHDGKIIRFLEKPSWGEVFSDTVNAGIYVLEPEAWRQIPLGKNFDFSYQLFPELIKSGQSVYGCVAQGYWSDIGQLKEYRRAHMELLNGHDRVIGPDCEIDESARIVNSVVGAGCKMGRGVLLHESIVWAGVEVGEGAELERVILGRGVKIGPRARLAEGVVVGDGAEIRAEANIRPYVKIWPRKVIEPETTVWYNCPD